MTFAPYVSFDTDSELKGADFVRQRPGRYFGDDTPRPPPGDMPPMPYSPTQEFVHRTEASR